MADFIQNARITRTMLGCLDDGPFSFCIMVEYGRSSGQGFGPYCIRGETGAGAIEGILNAVGVGDWEKLAGKIVRVKTEGDEWGYIRAIGHALDDEWFDTREYWPQKAKK